MAVVQFFRSHVWLIAGLVSFTIFLSTLQLTINGSGHPYTTDVGEIQNALPRWGTIHFPGYPLYSLSGSAFVTILRFLGIAPAAGTSLLSAFWGAIAIAILVVLQLSYDVRPVIALATSTLFALSTSFWIDASIAEVHTLTMVLYLGSVLFAVRFGRSGRRSDLLWLTFFASQAVLHQRAMVFMVFGLFVLVSRHLKNLLRSWIYIVGIAVVGALIYLYLPIRDLQGAEWTFDQPGTWQGFWSLVLDTKTDRIISLPDTYGQWQERVRAVVSVLENEWPIILILLGLIGNAIGAFQKSKREALGLFLLWFPFIVLSFVIWVGRIGDALLAVNLPLIAMSAFGLGLITSLIMVRSQRLGIAITVVWIAFSGLLFMQNRAEVLSVTKDSGAEKIILQAEEYRGNRINESETTLMALWGNDYWSLAYAQAFQNRLKALNLVDHNADLGSIMESNEHLITLAQTFYLRPLSWWDQQYGQVYLSSHSANLVEIDTSPPYDQSNVAPVQELSLGNGISVRRADLIWESPNQMSLTVFWEASEQIDSDFSVAVHLVSELEPDGPEDIIAQSDRQHPVSGWYPTSRWFAGEIVRDEYLIDIPQNSDPAAIRLSMYRQDVDGTFTNTEWLTLAIDRNSIHQVD
jgi:hypothetical protein